MPVMRAKERIRREHSGSVVRMQPDPMGAVMREGADVLARRAAQYAKSMAVAAEDEAKALAKAAVFSTGPSGLPVMPQDPTERMGEIARRTYDATIQDRFAHQMTSAIKAQINEAQNENLYDIDAFNADAEARIAEMSGDVPKGMEGMFQQIATGLMVDAGASIGYRQAQVGIQNSSSRHPAMITDKTATIVETIAAGDYDAAQIMIDLAIADIAAIPAHVMTDGQKLKHIEDIHFSAGLARLTHDLKLRDLSVPQLMDLSGRLHAGDDPEVLKYFTRPGMDAPDMDMARRAANHVNQLVGQANQRDAALKDATTKAARMDMVRNGYGEASEKNRAVLDESIASEIDLRTEDGLRAQMSPQTWLYLNDEQRHVAIRAVKTSGMLPKSLAMMFKRLDTVQDIEELEKGFLLYRDLIEAPNDSGEIVNMTGELGDRLLAIYGMVSDLHGDGWAAQEGISHAMLLVDGLGEQDWNDKRLAMVLNRDNRIGDGRGAVNEDNARKVMHDTVVKTIFDGVEALPEEKEQATRIFEMYLRINKSFDDAMQMTRQSMEGRSAETDKMLNTHRSSYAPEKYYPTPPSSSIGEFLQRGVRSFKSNSVHFAEFLAEIPVRLIPGDIPDSLRVDFAADRINASPFELLADVGVREILKNIDPEVAATYDTGWDLLKPGRDYRLTHAEGYGDQGVYHVWMVGPNGTATIMPGILDIREDWEKLMEFEIDLATLDRARKSRAIESAANWEAVFEAIDSGQSPAFVDIYRRMYEQGPEYRGPKVK